ncbi:hypothetical protein JHL22_12810 [Advenella sp. WQ 585]|uniref:Uncharacterized protein n=1 Tax=Advenella mandrilli TaxID=2800330 RepID=A0ABS1EGG4_9BURK|nr:hypothetical protein [Advenella mandrilli]MBK1782094.1 hypothetical protein [Advenella mandrilli]
MKFYKEMFKDRRFQKALTNYEVSKGWSTIFIFYALLVAGMIGQLLFHGMNAIGFSDAEGFAWFLGVICFVAATYYIINYPIIGVVFGGVMTIQMAVTAAYFTYTSNGLGFALAVFTIVCICSLIAHRTALEDLKNM